MGIATGDQDCRHLLAHGHGFLQGRDRRYLCFDDPCRDLLYYLCDDFVTAAAEPAASRRLALWRQPVDPVRRYAETALGNRVLLPENQRRRSRQVVPHLD